MHARPAPGAATVATAPGSPRSAAEPRRDLGGGEAAGPGEPGRAEGAPAPRLLSAPEDQSWPPKCDAHIHVSVFELNFNRKTPGSWWIRERGGREREGKNEKTG